MNAAQRRHYDAIRQLARDEWPADEIPDPTPTLGDNALEQVDTFHSPADGTIVMDGPEAVR